MWVGTSQYPHNIGSSSALSPCPVKYPHTKTQPKFKISTKIRKHSNREKEITNGKEIEAFEIHTLIGRRDLARTAGENSNDNTKRIWITSGEEEHEEFRLAMFFFFFDFLELELGIYSL